MILTGHKDWKALALAACALSALVPGRAAALEEAASTNRPAYHVSDEGREDGGHIRLEAGAPARGNDLTPGTLSLSGLRGEGGVFPTAGILGRDELSADYSVYFFDNDTDVINNNFEISFGLSESVEIGLAGNVVRMDTAARNDTYYATGPAVKWSPVQGDVYQLSIGGAVRFGDDELQRNQVLFAGSYRLYERGQNDWLVRTVTLNAGVMQEWFEEPNIFGADERDSLRGFASIALGLVNDWKAVFEAGTRDRNVDEDVPYSIAVAVPANFMFKSSEVEIEVVPSIVDDGSGAGPSIQLAVSVRR